MRTIILTILLFLLPIISYAKTPEYCLAFAAYTEAKDQGEHGMALVMHTILNRAKKRNKTPCQVIYEPNQYYAVLRWPRNTIPKSKTWLQALQISNKVINNQWNFGKCKGSEYFYAPAIVKRTPKWAYKIPHRCTYKGHIFHGKV